MDQRLSKADYGLIGHPLCHSFSKAFFTRLFEDRGCGKIYQNFDLPALNAASLYSLLLMCPKLEGFNVTSPYKLAVMEFLDSISETAEETGAVNTVKVIRDTDGRVRHLEGHNTDVEGFIGAIAPLTEKIQPGSGALVLGSGGASKAACVGLRRLGFMPLIVSRTAQTPGSVSYSDLTQETVAANKIIVNATLLGTFPDLNTYPPFPYSYITPGSVCFDMVYNPEETMFMKLCAMQGARVRNGLEMLFIQALASLKIWETSSKPEKSE